MFNLWSFLMISLLLSMLVFKYSIQYFDLMVLLLVLETLMLLNFYMLLLSQEIFHVSLLFFMCYFLFNVMEACVGLSVLVSMTRSYGHKMKSSF